MIPDNLFELNPGRRVTKLESLSFGVWMIDDFYAHPEAVVELAHALTYTDAKAITGAFPGVRAIISLDQSSVRETFSEMIGAKLRPSQEHDPVIFSALPPDIVSIRLPHWDGPGYFNAVVYLNDDDVGEGGTAFYRHRLTGLDRSLHDLDLEEIRALLRSVGVDPTGLTRGEAAEHAKRVVFDPRGAAPPGSYLEAGNEVWERIGQVDMRFNRAALFYGNSLHSMVVPEGSFRDAPRLVQTIFSTTSPPA